MFSYSADEVVVAFRGSKNLNAALKNFLKKEVGKDARSARFVKDLKAAFESKAPQRAENFVTQNMAAFEPHLLIVARYAYSEPIVKVAEQIINTHADEFNATYEKAASKIEVKDRPKFEKIVKEVSTSLDTLLPEQGVPASNFLKKAALFFVFEPEVLREVAPLLMAEQKVA